jgi:DNA invertase Pin-like site-specific DNA recombinase
MSETAATPAVAFAAKSTEDKRGSIPDQLSDCRELAARDCLDVVAEHHDEKASAYSGDRGPGLARALAACEQLASEHGDSALIVQHSDRLARGDGRKAKHLVEYAPWAMKAGVTIRSMQDDQTFSDLLYAVVTGQRNHEDSKRKSEATRAGMKRRAERGLTNGGPRPFGYDYDGYFDGTTPLRRIVILEPEAVIVRRIFAEYVAGRSQRQIVRDLNADGLRTQRGSAWVQGTVAKILASPLYVGKVRHHRDTYGGTHAPIIDAETWQNAEQLRIATARTGRGRRPRASHILAGGLLRCGCGAAMGAVTKPTRTPGVWYEVYQCNRRLDEGPESCPQKPIRRAVIDGVLWDFFAKVALDVDATRAAIADQHETKIAEIAAVRDHAERDVIRASDRLTHVRRDYQDGRLDADDWTEQRTELTGELEAAKAQVARLDKQRDEVAGEMEEVDAEAAVIEELTAIRALVTGEARDGSRQGVDAFRAALRRLFSSFELLGGPRPYGSGVDDGESVAWPHDDLALDGGPLALFPRIRRDAIEGWG